MRDEDCWDSLDDTTFVGPDQFDFAGQYLTASDKEAKEARSYPPLNVKDAVETRMSGKALNKGSFNSLRALTDQNRAAHTLPLPVEAGVRVEFAANLGSLLTYDNPPDPNEQGVVVAVRSASGNITTHGTAVFVQWQDGSVRPIQAEHLRAAKGKIRTTASRSGDTIRVASLGDLSGFMRMSSDTLVHKATKDLWAVRQEGSEYVIERLFKESGDPLKE